MASSLLSLSLLSPLPSASSFSPKTLSHPHLLLRRRPRLAVASRAKNGNSGADPADRLIAASCYLYPFLDGVQYGRYVLTQFPAFQVLLQPLLPAVRLFRASPLNGFLLFLTLYFAVVRNPSAFSHYVRFNTMQAIVLDVLLIFPDLLERTFNLREGLGFELLQSVDSTVFFFLLVSLVYGSTSCLLGHIPRLPIVAEAAERQVM